MILGTNQGQTKYILLHFPAEFPLKSTGEISIYLSTKESGCERKYRSFV